MRISSPRPIFTIALRKGPEAKVLPHVVDRLRAVSVSTSACDHERVRAFIKRLETEAAHPLEIAMLRSGSNQR